MQGRLPIIVALAVGLLAVIFTNMYVSDIRQASLPEVAQVMVAAHDLRPGAVLEGKDVAMAMKAAGSLPKLAVRWDERSLYLGQEIGFQVAEGDYILGSYFGAQGAIAQRLSEKIDAKLNQRAMTIPVDNMSSLEGSIRPGDRIDLLLTFQEIDMGSAPAGTGKGAPGGPVGRPKLVTVPLLENTYVLFTGFYGSQASERGYPSITLLVTSDEAKLLIWSMNLGKLSILLRNPKDLQSTDRAYLIGDASLLQALGRHQMRPEDVLSNAGGAVKQ